MNMAGAGGRLAGSAAASIGLLLATAATCSAQDRLGVEPCDTFLAKYETCLATKVWPTSQAPAKATLNDLRAMWKFIAADPTIKDRLAEICRQSIEAIKPQIETVGCTW